MIKTIARTALVAGAALALGGIAQAEDFPATPLQHGAPHDLPGERLIPGAQLAVDVINGVTQPILQPILAPGEAAPAPAAAPAAHHRRHLAGRHHPRHVAARHLHHKTA